MRAECARRHRVKRPAHAPPTLVEDVEEDVARHKELPGRLRSTQARPRAQGHNARAAAAQRVGKEYSWLNIRSGGISSFRFAANAMRSANQHASGHHFARCKSPCAEVSVAASLRIVVQRRTNHAKRGDAEQSPLCARAARPTQGWKSSRGSNTSRSDDVDERSLRLVSPSIYYIYSPEPSAQNGTLSLPCWFL